MGTKQTIITFIIQILRWQRCPIFLMFHSFWRAETVTFQRGRSAGLDLNLDPSTCQMCCFIYYKLSHSLRARSLYLFLSHVFLSLLTCSNPTQLHYYGMCVISAFTTLLSVVRYWGQLRTRFVGDKGETTKVTLFIKFYFEFRLSALQVG